MLELRSDGTCTVVHLPNSWRYLQGHDGYNTFSGNWHLTDYLVTNNQTITCVVITTDSLPQGSGSVWTLKL